MPHACPCMPRRVRGRRHWVGENFGLCGHAAAGPAVTPGKDGDDDDDLLSRMTTVDGDVDERREEIKL